MPYRFDSEEAATLYFCASARCTWSGRFDDEPNPLWDTIDAEVNAAASGTKDVMIRLRLRAAADRYLGELHSSTWGRSWDVIGTEGRSHAVNMIMETMEGVLATANTMAKERNAEPRR